MNGKEKFRTARTDSQIRPTLNFNQETDGERVEFVFGYLKGIATAAVYVGMGSRKPVAFIPRHAMQIAVEQGWEEEPEEEGIIVGEVKS